MGKWQIFKRRFKKKLGFDIGNSETPITPCIIGDEKKAQQFSKRLFEEGVYAKSIVFPTVPRGTARVRNMPTAAHTKEMLDKALQIYEKKSVKKWMSFKGIFFVNGHSSSFFISGCLHLVYA